MEATIIRDAKQFTDNHFDGVCAILLTLALHGTPT